MKTYAIAALCIFTASVTAQTSTTAAQSAAPPKGSDMQAQAQQLVELSFQIQAEVHAMKKFELSLKALRKIDETQAVIRRMRSAAPPLPPAPQQR